MDQLGQLNQPKDVLEYLVQELRTLARKHPAEVTPLVEYLVTFPFRKELFDQVNQWAKDRKFVALLSEIGMSDHEGFWSELNDKVSFKILPPIVSSQEFLEIIRRYFDQPTDYLWVQRIPNEAWAQFASIATLPKPVYQNFEKEVLNTLHVLAHKVAAIGIEREVISKLPHLDDLDSPFLAVSREITGFVESRIFQQNREESVDYKHIRVIIGQCQTQINQLYKHKDRYGISLKMTLLIRKLEKYLSRMKQLLSWLETQDSSERLERTIRLFKEMVETQNTQQSIRKYLRETLQFLSFKIVENTSKTGENYIATTPKEFWILFRKALGGGVVVAFLCVFKTLIYYLHLPIFWEAFFYSLNYAIGFVLIHLFSFTLATKQPAMTASTIAATLSDGGRNKDWLQNSTKLLTRLIRSQFISLLGNAIIAFPVAFGISWLVFGVSTFHIATEAKAIKMVDELHPIFSLALPHAAIAGIYLMISGLISGYYENKWIYENWHIRLSQNRRLQRLISPPKLKRLAEFLDVNVGALSGNIALGFFLGCTSAIGFTFGLPLDIRHITFASGNFGLAAAGQAFPQSEIIWSILGIIGIGLVNVLVSFGLSLVIAFNSRGTRWPEIKALMVSLIRQFFQNGHAFIYPTSRKK